MRLLLLGMGVSFLGAVITLAQSQNPKAQSGSERRYDYAELSKAPEKARSRHDPLAEDDTVVAGGKKLFEQHCAECHGGTAQGGKKAPSLRVAEVQDDRLTPMQSLAPQGGRLNFEPDSAKQEKPIGGLGKLLQQDQRKLTILYKQLPPRPLVQSAP